MNALLLDTHVVHWWSAEPDRISTPARDAIEAADELAVAAISWFELAWLARHERIILSTPLDAWLSRLSGEVRTLGITPRIAATAVSLPSSFPGDPADRLIYATAIEHGCKLVTKDQSLRGQPHPSAPTLW